MSPNSTIKNNRVDKNIQNQENNKTLLFISTNTLPRYFNGFFVLFCLFCFSSLPRIFFSTVKFLCWPIRYTPGYRNPFHPRITAVAPKRSRSFCQRCRWQVTAKHTCTLALWLWMNSHNKLVHGWMVYIERAPRRQLFHVAPATQQPNSAASTQHNIQGGY